MSGEILRCAQCLTYSLEKMCPQCKNQCSTPKPARFSPEDKYGKYRRLAKKEQRE